jgi:peptidoglycan/LPS O-acetylase OafA/YrhL
MTTKPGFRIVSLDGIRAVAALIVFVSHNGLEELIPGGFGVSIFFFLSGYLICTLLRMEYAGTGWINLRDFYLRRVYRIFPPFYIVLLLFAVPPFGHLGRETTAAAVIGQIAQLTNYVSVFGTQKIIPLTAPMWSLAVEEHFYLLFPVALRALLGRFDSRRIALILLIACAAALAWRYVLVFALHASPDYIYVATDTRFDALLYGCVMAIAFNPALDQNCLRLSARVWGVIVAASLAVLAFTLVYRDPVFRQTLRYTLQGIALFPVFFCAVRYHRWLIFRWLEHPWVRGLGIISYTFYLVHEKCLQMAGRLVGHGLLVRGVVGLLFTIAVSTLMYYLVERRFAALRKKLHREYRRPGPERPATTSTAAIQP